MHTPGEWKAREIKGDIFLQGTERGGATMPVAILRRHHVTPLEIFAANARLIAAAPALLEALEKILVKWGNLHPDDRDLARAAIQSAKGDA